MTWDERPVKKNKTNPFHALFTKQSAFVHQKYSIVVDIVT
jgi:hypothetical protein